MRMTDTVARKQIECSEFHAADRGASDDECSDLHPRVANTLSVNRSVVCLRTHQHAECAGLLKSRQADYSRICMQSAVRNANIGVTSTRVATANDQAAAFLYLLANNTTPERELCLPRLIRYGSQQPCAASPEQLSSDVAPTAGTARLAIVLAFNSKHQAQALSQIEQWSADSASYPMKGGVAATHISLVLFGPMSERQLSHVRSSRAGAQFVKVLHIPSAFGIGGGALPHAVWEDLAFQELTRHLRVTKPSFDFHFWLTPKVRVLRAGWASRIWQETDDSSIFWVKGSALRSADSVLRALHSSGHFAAT